ncbi:hypothetical protein K504DRAFT_457763 [Pleomassaria siparia CBS 279.74]|uniref:Uncharacterized protein n=1 Tax=Pleomassaria siparia CBS 279.74 TaxID=1314801 RepID=A0A6G1KRT8_9PLEO|nr:hypothetical protein K504DRAFT_457763 [Pleomassaria siparia CBS 279.74]
MYMSIWEASTHDPGGWSLGLVSGIPPLLRQPVDMTSTSTSTSTSSTSSSNSRRFFSPTRRKQVGNPRPQPNTRRNRRNMSCSPRLYQSTASFISNTLHHGRCGVEAKARFSIPRRLALANHSVHKHVVIAQSSAAFAAWMLAPIVLCMRRFSGRCGVQLEIPGDRMSQYPCT